MTWASTLFLLSASVLRRALGCAGANPETKNTGPYLLNVQSELIEDLATRVVVPLYPANAMKGKTLKTLTPTFELDGKQYVMVTPQLAGVPKKSLGLVAADFSSKRDEIIAALDLLITGI